MMNYDAIVLGTGGVGSAALFHLARRGVRALGLDRFPPGHDRGSSHGSTRIIRQAYFEHPDYVPLLLRAYELWAELEQLSGQSLYRQVGLLQVGPTDGAVVPGVLASAQQHGLPIETLSAGEVARRWPDFGVPESMTGLFEVRAGYLRVEACVAAHAEQAVRHGAELRVGETIERWTAEANGGFVVETERERYAAPRLIVTAGAWNSDLLAELKLDLHVKRKPQYWYRPQQPAGYSADAGYPTFLFETPDGVYYGFPQHDALGVKVAQHTGGSRVPDPLTLDRELDAADRQCVERFAAQHLPALSRELTHHSVCMYTMSRDENFIVDRHPRHAGLAFAAGLSGHGFKFTAILGQMLAELVLDGQAKLPLSFLAHDRPALQANRS